MSISTNKKPTVLNRIAARATHMYKLYVKRDAFLKAAHRWFRDRGDDALRLDYPLDSDCHVVDVGGYQGDFAEAIYKRFRCHIVVFEPVPIFYVNCINRFAGIEKVRVIDCGLGAVDETLPIEVAEDASSFSRSVPSATVQTAKVRRADTMLSELGLKDVDLLKINIEGGEYELLWALVESGWISRIRYLQVQFHNFVPDAVAQRDALREKLMETHSEMWNYEFVWESWCLRK